MATRETISAPLLSALQAESDAQGRVSWAVFSRIALFHETHGYYQSNRQRVGKGQTTDFYTSVSVGPVFGELVAEAARQLISPANPADYTLAEIGPEPDGGMFAGLDTGFGRVKSFPLGNVFQADPLTVLVANEVLDAQPFHRLEFYQGQWRELGVAVDNGTLTEVPLDTFSAPVQEQLAQDLPSPMLEGYRLDLPLAAEPLLSIWAAGDWKGAMILIDYGKFWGELVQTTPQGTARAYYRHQQETDLLARPGEQDLTTHVCWERLESTLQKSGFSTQIERQESFIVKRAWKAIERLSVLPENRGQIQSLIHPGGFGAKFQVLTATRQPESP